MSLKKNMLLTIDDLTIKMKYCYEKNYKYNGQLKLLLSTLNFLIDNLTENDIILYIGSGKGFNIPILIRIFAEYNIEWHLYDPNGHCYSLENNGEIYVNNKIFNIQEAERFLKIKNRLLFISDIRTTEGDSVKTTDLLKNYELQNNIIDYLNPRVSLLKWRCPFPDDWIKEFKVPCGKEFLQPYAPKFSNELRLSCKSPYVYKSITREISEDYEGLMYYYNKVLRKKNNIKIVEYILGKLDKNMKKNIDIDNMTTTEIIEHLTDLIQEEKKNTI